MGMMFFFLSLSLFKIQARVLTYYYAPDEPDELGKVIVGLHDKIINTT